MRAKELSNLSFVDRIKWMTKWPFVISVLWLGTTEMMILSIVWFGLSSLLLSLQYLFFSLI